MAAYQDNDDLPRAIAALTIFDVWARAASDGAILSVEGNPQRDGLVKSPFREDGRKGSFSICHGGKGYKDFGGDGASGGIWKFAKMCWPGLQPREVATLLIELSGITPTPRGTAPRNDASAPAAGAAPIDPALSAAAKALARRDKARAAEEAVYANREKLLAPRMEAKPVPSWPDFVRERYEAGESRLRSATAVMSKLAKDRGWDPVWVCELVNMGLIAYPLERWHDLGGPREVHQLAFRVEVPEIKTKGVPGTAESSAVATLRTVGYHQRYFMLGKPGEEPTKGWLYVPSVPKNGAKSTFEKLLLAHGAERGVTPQNLSGLIPPMPFVMGDVGAAKLIVILEGQWDAITFFGACGYFEDATPPVGVAVFGIRGAQGVDVFLAYWQWWLRHNRPAVWVIADNDKAGREWLNPKAKKAGEEPPPSFAARLGYLGCKYVKQSLMNDPAFGKDFNDYYRIAKPTPVKMRAWMARVVGELLK